MNLLTGEYNNTIDDKGRVSFPVKLRTAVNQDVLIITKGLDTCLWLFTVEEWDNFAAKIMGNASMMKKKNLDVIRHFIAPDQHLRTTKELLDEASSEDINYCLWKIPKINSTDTSEN